jgi:hypothetical protein
MWLLPSFSSEICLLLCLSVATIEVAKSCDEREGDGIRAGAGGMQQHEQSTEKIFRSDAARVVGNDVGGSGSCVWELEELVVAAVVGT